MSKVMQILHGDFTAWKGQNVTPNTIIGTGNGHGAGMMLAPHDHRAIGVNSTPTHSGWYNGCNKTQDPMNVLKGIDNNDINAHFVFNQSQGWGGYGYLEQTVYNWYTDCRDNSLHDGIDFYAPLGSTLYAGVYGVVTDVGQQSNGLTYCYIEIQEGDNVKTNNDYKGKARAKENLKMYYDTDFTTIDRVMDKGEEFYYQAFNGGWIISQQWGDKHYVRFAKHSIQDYFEFVKINNS